MAINVQIKVIRATSCNSWTKKKKTCNSWTLFSWGGVNYTYASYSRLMASN